MLEILSFLVLFPLLAAVLMLVLPNGELRDCIVKIAALITAAGSIWLFISAFGKGTLISSVGSEIVGIAVFYAEFAISLIIIAVSLKYKKYAVTALGAIQLVLLHITELGLGVHAELANELFVDEFSLIMALIIGIIGGIICVYSTGYMKGYHELHADVQDRRKFFFFVIFLFLSAMFGIVFANNIMWLFMFWEITTLCSFLLIGYSRDETAINNSFLALKLNMLGGVVFAAAIIYILKFAGAEYIYLDQLIASGPAVAIIPAALIAFAGLTKSAQFPFSAWLVGAMVAPTPVSALLHSSTMVKAGVYVIVRFAPVFAMTLTGMVISLIGGFTFLIASAIAVSQTNAKKVLAYSTIANLGLIVACAGIGIEAAVWAAILLIIFHAVAKALLFLSVGSVEHQKHSRDIEDMGGLYADMPKITILMLIGIAGMFLAPFGMLISKWASLEAFVGAMPPFGMVLVIILAYGSGLTVLFWAKMMGRLIEVKKPHAPIEKEATGAEMFSLYALGALTVISCIAFPVISGSLIEPYLYGVYAKVIPLISPENAMMLLIMVLVMFILPLSIGRLADGRKVVSQYMSGRPADADLCFAGSLGRTMETNLGNYYFEELFGEKKMFRIGVIISVMFLVILLLVLAYMFTGGILL